MFKKKVKELLAQYKDIKHSIFDFEKIKLYFDGSDHQDYFQIISERTANDLDYEELFHFLDRTCSSVGQQYLYHFIRTIPNDDKRRNENEKQIAFLQKNAEHRRSIVIELSKLNTTGAYYIQSLFNKDHILRPRWFFLVPILSLLAFSSLIFVFFYPPALLALIGVVLINFILHYWNKRNLMVYSNSIPQLNVLGRVARKMLKTGIFDEHKKAIADSTKEVEAIGRQALIFNWDSQKKDDFSQLFDSFLELFKASLLLEILFTFIVIKKLEAKKGDLRIVFEAVAQVDTSVSILSLRETTSHVIPEFSQNNFSLSAQEIYHPLIEDPIANTIDIQSKTSALITGSNMSGKTTFIRTLGINAILAQTINTAFATKFQIPQMKVHSAIRITDDLMENTSYYYEEVKVIKELSEESRKSHFNLFLLDELFKGTNTVERVASGKAVLSYLSNNQNFVFASTHDIELADLLEQNFEFYHFTEQIKNGELDFDYRIKTGKLTETNAIRVLEINNYPQEITNEARSLAAQLAKGKRS